MSFSIPFIGCCFERRLSLEQSNSTMKKKPKENDRDRSISSDNPRT